MNSRADLFNENAKANMPGTFEMQEIDDAVHSVLFKSNITVKEQTLPFAVITDDSIFPIVRVFVANRVVNDDNRGKILDYINNVNRQYKVFKYYIEESGSIVIDACIPALDEHFDVQAIHTVIDVIIDHLNNDYANIMDAIWGKTE